MLAAILESGEPERLYTGLSLLVSTAAEGEEARALVTFGALPRFATNTFEDHLGELRAAADEVGVRFYACAAAVEATGAAGELEVMSTPRFLKETAGARLVVV